MRSFRLARWKNNNLIWSLFCVCWIITVPVYAESQEDSWQDLLGFSGSVRAAYWSENKGFDAKQNFSANSAWLTLKPKEMAGFQLYAESYVTNDDSTRSKFTEGVLREAYVERSLGDFDFRIGRQIIVWGRADKVNPTDNLTVKNFRRLFTDDEDQRLGAFATQIVYNIDSIRLRGVWQPEWIAPIFPISEQPGLRIDRFKPSKPEEQFGVKLDASGGALDWSLSYFHGYAKTPNIEFLGASGGVNQAGLVHDRIQVYGGDIAGNLGDIGLRAEAAFTRTSDESGNDFFKQNSFFYGVLGGDKNLAEDLNLNVQFLYRHIFDFRDPNLQPVAALRELSKLQSIVTQQEREDQFGISLRPNYKLWNQTLELEVAFVSWLVERDFLMRPKVTYAISDHWKAILGGELYRGRGNTFFGRLHDTSALFTELRFLF